MHCFLNAPGVVCKYFALFSFDIYDGLPDSDPYKLSETEINNHLIKCMKIKFYFPSTDRKKGKIHTYGNNIRKILKNWETLKLLVQCSKKNCKYDPWKYKLYIYIYI